MWKTGAQVFTSLSRSSYEVFKMALTSVRAKTNFFVLPFAVGISRFALTRSITKMARSCKAGRNKRREVKVGLKCRVICSSYSHV